ncbi:DUF5908 family protein [Vicingaceae bacterium]|nr:DUF5908 family protein [Vicingaceae bacterium]
MPIEIKELVIKTTVNEAKEVSTNNIVESVNSSNDNNLGEELSKIRRDIVNECMENFSHLLKQINDR